MFKVLLCVSTEHDWRLVMVAALVCVPSTLAAFFLYSRVPSFPAWRRWTWLALTGLVAGSGIWTTHFVAMLAFETGLPTGFVGLPTIASLAVAVLSTTLGFAAGSAPAAPERRGQAALAGGLVVGLGITLMHYVGMMGYRTAGHLQWDPAYVVASVAIGAALAAAALFVSRPAADWKRQLMGGGLLSLGIVGMHFTGMTAVTILPDPSVAVPQALLHNTGMGIAAVAVTALIIAASIGGVLFDTASRNGNLRRLREALDVLPEGLAFYDASDRLVAWNNQYETLFRECGASLSVGSLFSDLLQTSLVHGAYPAAVGREAEWLEERHTARRDLLPNLVHQTSGGRWLRITERRTGDGGTVSVSIDITDLKRAEGAMAEARDKAKEQAHRAEAAEQVAGLGHWRVDVAEDRITGSSELFRILGLEADAKLDLGTVLRMCHPDDAEPLRLKLQHQMATGEESETWITRIVRGDGALRHLSASSRCERGEDGTIAAVIGAVVDVTEQQVLESELRHARAEAETAAAVKSDFLANMSHELRTPLTSIIGFTGLASAQSDLSDLTRTYVERVGHASRALLCTVNDILDFSKLEAGQVSFQPQPVSIEALGRATLDLFTPQAGSKDLTLTLDGDGDPTVLLDPDRIRQILLNLVGNAVKFTEAGGVTLRTRYDAAAQSLLVEVVDTGPGIPGDRQGRLFQRFSQIDGSTTRAGGTGLGLAICKGLVEAMGGEIAVDSRPGEGSRFWFRVPAAAADPVPAQDEPGQAEIPMFAGVRVLVVDDHPANRELARLYLAGAGAEVSEAADGVEAAEMAALQPYDVILMDMRMPRLDGPGALGRIRAAPGPNVATPILAFSADADDEAQDRFAALGFQDVIAKPMDPLALIRAVGEATTLAGAASLTAVA